MGFVIHLSGWVTGVWLNSNKKKFNLCVYKRCQYFLIIFLDIKNVHFSLFLEALENFINKSGLEKGFINLCKEILYLHIYMKHFL